MLFHAKNNTAKLKGTNLFSYSVSVMSQIVSTKRVLALVRVKLWPPIFPQKSIATEIILTAKKVYLTLFRLGGGRGFSNPPSGKIVITPTPKELWRSNFLTFPKIYLGTFWYNYHVHVINRVAMATSFWHIGFGKFKKWWFFCFKIAFLHL